MKKLSYHDVVVFVNSVRYRIFDHYDIELSCNRVGGWNLWRTHSNGSSTLIGGEYSGDDFRIEVDGRVVCGKQNESQP